MSDALDLVVVGAGVCGLGAAWRAKQAGKRVLVLEAAPRVGGVIRTESVGGYRMERAASSFPSTSANLLALVESLPNKPAIREPSADAGKQYLLLRRGLVPIVRSPAGLVASGLLPGPGMVRAMLEMARGPRRSTEPESAHAFVRRRFGGSIADRLLRPMTTGIYGADPTELGAADAFPALVGMEREHGGVLRALMKKRSSGGGARRVFTFEGGMESLPRAVGAALGDAVRISARIDAIQPRADGVDLALDSGEIVSAREALLAAPAYEQARLLARVSPSASEILETVRYIPMVVVGVGIPPGGSPPISRCFGFLRGVGSPARILGASFPFVLDPTCAPEGHALLTVYVGGSRDTDAPSLSDDEIRSIVEHDLAAALGGPVRPDLVSLYRHRRAIPVFAPGHRARMASAQSLVSAVTGSRIRLSGSHVTGVALESCTTPSTDLPR